jgi:putative addiction module component (TIGR02574 family)
VSTVAEVLSDAMSLPPNERAAVAQSLLRSLPPGPQVFHTESQLARELQNRVEAVSQGGVATMPAEATLRRAREAVRQVRKP